MKKTFWLLAIALFLSPALHATVFVHTGFKPNTTNPILLKNFSVDSASFDKATEKTDKSFSLGGFLLGFLGFPGLLIAALIGKRHLRWALLGFGIAIIIFIVWLINLGSFSCTLIKFCGF